MHIAAEQKHRNADNTLCKKLQHKNSKGNKNVIFKWKKVDDGSRRGPTCFPSCKCIVYSVVICFAVGVCILYISSLYHYI